MTEQNLPEKLLMIETNAESLTKKLLVGINERSKFADGEQVLSRRSISLLNRDLQFAAPIKIKAYEIQRDADQILYSQALDRIKVKDVQIKAIAAMYNQIHEERDNLKEQVKALADQLNAAHILKIARTAAIKEFRDWLHEAKMNSPVSRGQDETYNYLDKLEYEFLDRFCPKEGT